jgi:hypothetical protein
MRTKYVVITVVLSILAVVAARFLRKEADRRQLGEAVSALPQAQQPPPPPSQKAAPELAAPAPPAEMKPEQTLVPRDPEEWQGMLVDLDMLQSECQRSTDCGLAMACKQGRCAPCDRNADCGPGEICALQHCVISSKAECTNRKDCREAGNLCILTGYTPNIRGNEDMESKCLANTGGVARSDVEAYVPHHITGEPASPTKSLLEEL